MEQLEVRNTTSEEITVMWDGMQVYFKPNQKRSFDEGVARNIINEAKGLEIVGEEVEKEDETEEVPTEEPVDEPSDGIEMNEYQVTQNKIGVTQYRKNGKLISKKEYKNRNK